MLSNSISGEKVVEYEIEIKEYVDELPEKYSLNLKFENTLNFLKEHGCKEEEVISHYRSARAIDDPKFLLPGDRYINEKYQLQDRKTEEKSSGIKRIFSECEELEESESEKKTKYSSPSGMESVHYKSPTIEQSDSNRRSRRRTLYSPRSFEKSSDCLKLFGVIVQ